MFKEKILFGVFIGMDKAIEEKMYLDINML